MAKFEGYERREAKILAALKEYGINSIDECKEICDNYGIDPYKIVEETQPICFENAKWAYTVGAAIAALPIFRILQSLVKLDAQNVMKPFMKNCCHTLKECTAPQNTTAESLTAHLWQLPKQRKLWIP